MLKPRPRAFRTMLIFLLVLALGAVFTSNAQSTPLTQFAKTLDGQISMRLPDGWQFRDAANPYLASVLAIGDNATSLQAAINSLTSTEASNRAAMNGIVAIVNPQLISGLSGDLAVNTMVNSLISSVQQTGGRVLQQESTMIGNQYPGTIALVSNTATDAQAIIGVFQAGQDIVEFTIGASPASGFTNNQDMFFSMVDSIRVPGEEGVPDIQPAQPTAVPVNPVVPAGEGGVVAAPSGAFSVRLPQGYVSETVTVINFADIIAFGDNAATEQAVAQMFTAGTDPGNFSGIAGIVGEVDSQLLNGQAVAALAAPLMQSMLAAVQTGAVTVVQQPQAHTYGGQYNGQLAELNLGYLGVLHTDEHLLVVMIISDKVAANRAQMDAILDGIRIPAEAAVQPLTIPTQAAPTPIAAQPTEAQTVRSSDLRVSLVLPASAVVLDHIADANILAYGDSSDAAQSRLFSAKPDLASETAISGNGGLIILYPMSQFDIDPANPDLSALMTRALGNLQGYTVVQAAQPLEGSPNALFAVISGTEQGYLALIPFGDQIAYVTSTSDTSAAFEVNEGVLLDIVKSVRVPAELEPTPAPTAAGLGGLGGLGEATPEATPEATSAGIGGL